eukprot:scaffold282_cov345-Pavlova_lutheri.AAC.36
MIPREAGSVQLHRWYNDAFIPLRNPFERLHIPLVFRPWESTPILWSTLSRTLCNGSKGWSNT